MEPYKQVESGIGGDELSFDEFRSEVLDDYRLACVSRQLSIVGRREVLNGKGKFGIFGAGKELAQIAWAKSFKEGDWRSGYYRDQTIAFAKGISSVSQYLAQLYGDTDLHHEPNSGGRQMTGHFCTRNIDEDGNFVNLMQQCNTMADSSPTSSQIPPALGLAFASKVFRRNKVLQKLTNLSHQGDEVCFATIGDASTSEGHFWEVVNAAGVLQVPLAILVWDDGYGISVPRELQTTKNSISRALEGFQMGDDDETGLDIYTVKGWDYQGLCEVFERGIRRVRKKHVPALFHVQELTQPQGHSTSGSHERYKSRERLKWEKEWDCNHRMRLWILENSLASEEDLDRIEKEAKDEVARERIEAYERFQAPLKKLVKKTVKNCNELMTEQPACKKEIKTLAKELISLEAPLRKDVLETQSKILHLKNLKEGKAVDRMRESYDTLKREGQEIYDTYLYASGVNSALRVEKVDPVYSEQASEKNGFEILNEFFDAVLDRNPKVYAFGEDVGMIGDVNQGFRGLQKKHGKNRVFDTGIRESAIVGQAIGMALRGLRPIVEIQYLEYVLYCLQQLRDEVASLQYRTVGQQYAPVIIRTRGHRLEGIWHSGSPMGLLTSALRGMYICVPRDMVQAAGMYNTLLKANEPGIVIECLNGYRLKEKLPDNLAEVTVPLGIPEVIHEGSDVTIVSYGSVLRVAEKAIQRLEKEQDISCELIDVRTLLPFDLNKQIVESLKKTSRILFLDEDVPGGGTAYMFQEVIENQGGYRYLDVAPKCLSAKAHRPSYGSDGDYFSLPNEEDIIDQVIKMMAE